MFLRTLRSVWKKISDKPLPEIYAFTFDDNDFLFMLNLLQKSPGVEETRVKEYGVDFDNKFIEACPFKIKEYFVILVRQSVPLNDSLIHELTYNRP